MEISCQIESPINRHLQFPSYSYDKVRFDWKD
jgi:hypothetical protein